MAEIRVEKKRGSGNWLWLALLLVIVAAVVIYLWQSGTFGAATGQIEHQLAVLEETWHVTNHA